MTPVRTRFLIADDDPDDVSLFYEALKLIAPGMTCISVESGVEVFELLAKHQVDKPDIIFLDINMPLMNGWECLRKLKSSPDYRDIPAIMYSTSSAKKDINQAYSLGASLFLTKPEDFRELCQILEVVATTSEDSLLSRLQGFGSVKLQQK